MGLMHLLGLHSMVKLSDNRLRALINYFGEYEAAWENFAEWPNVLGKNVDYAELKREWAAADLPALYEKFLLSDAKIVTMADEGYPKLLAAVADAPYVLFYRGELPTESDITVAIVGSRRATAYGKEAAAYFANDLALSGAWIVGGMARGIDSAAHRAALDIGGKTVGVLGCGIDVVYPPENRDLYKRAAESGCIISEYPLGTKPLGRNFPMRNRVISGLSLGVLVVEAGAKSGTQITVNYAEAQNRQIFAVPGSIFSPASIGTLNLIKNNTARAVANARDILDDLSGYAAVGGGALQQLSFDMELGGDVNKKTAIAPAKAQPLPAGETERRIVEFVTEQRHFNDIARELDINAAELAGTLTLMELGGFIKRLDGQYYIRSSV